MQFWMWYIVSGAVGLTAYNVATKISGSNSEPFLSITIATVASAIILTLVTGIHYYKKDIALIGELSTNGVITSLVIGVCFTVVNLSYLLAFDKGAPVGVVGPIISVASMAFIVTISILFFGEEMTVNKAIGALSIFIGVIFLMKG